MRVAFFPFWFVTLNVLSTLETKQVFSFSKYLFKLQVDSLPEFYPTLAQVSIPRNPSPFAVFAAVRATCLENRRRQTALLQLQSTSSWKDGDDADANDGHSEEEQDKKHVLPKIIGIGLQGVFEIIRECKNTHPGAHFEPEARLTFFFNGPFPASFSLVYSGLLLTDNYSSKYFIADVGI